MDNVDPHIREVVKAACEELPLPKLPVVPARANREHAIAIFEKREVDEAVEPSDERIREPLTVGFRQRAAGRSTSLSKALPQTRTLAMGRSARIAIKAKGRILFIDAADVIAVEAKGKYVLLLHTSSSHMLRESISTMEEKLNLHGFVRIHRSVHNVWLADYSRTGCVVTQLGLGCEASWVRGIANVSGLHIGKYCAEPA